MIQRLYQKYKKYYKPVIRQNIAGICNVAIPKPMQIKNVAHINCAKGMEYGDVELS